MKNAYGETETARRYDSARGLAAETKTLWLETLKAAVPVSEVACILDLGCGTGRFTSALAEAYGCAVVGVEPSTAMLDIARSRGEPHVVWKQGGAEDIPLESGSVDLVFMSQVFHHLAERGRALREVGRVLTPTGYFAVRNGTREQHEELAWLKCFPEALELEERRMPSRRELAEAVCAQSFDLISRRTVRQLFASSYEEYFEKISQRGLSSLIAIGDAAFESGLERLRHFVSLQPRETPVHEPVDLFVFRKRPA
ncbi:MAG: methyltransferase domain-containing protein [Acidobacteria bacterium]|nr:methyltransferase domain-containing protein [Acidobacteriota bacterium]